MLQAQKITASFTCSEVPVPDNAASIHIRNRGLVDVKFSVNSCANTTNYFTIKAGESLSDLSVDNTVTLHFITEIGTTTLELLWD